jgi:hypothetical protein
MARRYRRPVDLVRAAAAWAAPGVVDAVGTARARARIPASWRDEAEAWLAAVVPAEPLAVTG